MLNVGWGMLLLANNDDSVFNHCVVPFERVFGDSFGWVSKCKVVTFATF